MSRSSSNPKSTATTGSPLRRLLSYIKEYADHGKFTTKEHGKESKPTLKFDPALKRATKELRMFLGRFANGKSIGTIIDTGNALMEDGRQGEELSEWFWKIDVYVHKVFLSLILHGSWR
jgi:hypothetical protein